MVLPYVFLIFTSKNLSSLQYLLEVKWEPENKNHTCVRKREVEDAF